MVGVSTTGEDKAELIEMRHVKQKQKETTTLGTNVSDKAEDTHYRVRLPGFISDEEIGLGDLIKKATAAIGIKPCGGCTRRAAVLNRWMVFSGKR